MVSGSFQGFDTGFMHEALRVLGPTFTGVIQIPPTASDDEIMKLDAIGVRGVRFNMARGGSADVADLENMAKRVWALARWHVELYADARDLAMPIVLDIAKTAADPERIDRLAELLTDRRRSAARASRRKRDRAPGFCATLRSIAAGPWKLLATPTRN